MVSKRKQALILKQVQRTTNAYQKFKVESNGVNELVEPYIQKAVKEKDSKLLNQLLDLTSPVDKNGQYLVGDFLGRFYIFLALQEIKQKKK